MEKAEKLIQNFLKAWNIEPGDFFFEKISDNEICAQAIYPPDETKLQEMIESGQNFGFVISLSQPPGNKSGFATLVFRWDDLEETALAMSSINLTASEFAQAVE